jgi:ribosome maturation factor RimP
LALDGAFERRPERPAAFLLVRERMALRGKTAEDARLLELLDPVAEASGYEIVRLRLTGADRGRRLQIMAERPDGTMPIEDCAALSRAVIEVLDAAAPIGGEVSLEVSSPGIDRPLTRPKDFATWSGCEARLELDRLLDGRRRFKGRITGVDGDEVIVQPDDEEGALRIPFASLAEAKLVITDDLMQRGAASRAARLGAAASGEETKREGRL